MKRLRVDLDKKRKELNEGALHYQRTVNATAKTLTEKIGAVESRLEAERENYENEKLKEKQAKEAAKAAVLNERVSRLSAAGIHVTDLRMIEGMAADEFEFYFARESRLAAEAKAEAERVENLRQEELKRQAEELRIRAEEIERQRLADEAALAEERKANEAQLEAERRIMEAERAEMRRQQEEVNRQQAELRAKAEAEAAEKRRKEKEAEQARREAAAAPELEKLNSVLDEMRFVALRKLENLGNPSWREALSGKLKVLSTEMNQIVRDLV